MIKIDFQNGKTKLNKEMFDTFQNNIEAGINEAINETVETINSKDITIGNEVETDEVVGGKRVYKKRIKFVSGSEGYQSTGLSNCTLINWNGYGYNASGYGVSCPGDINMQVENVNKLDRVHFTGAIKIGYTPIITFWYTKEA